MAGNDHQKQLLSLIRDFAAEKSQGERRIGDLKKRQQELRSELDAANAELEEAKRCRETVEQEMKGYEVELSMNESSVQSLQARNSAIQDQVSVINSDIEELKMKEASMRDEFIDKMFKLNNDIRKFTSTMSSDLIEEDTVEDSEAEDQFMKDKIEAIPGISIEDKLKYVISQIEIEEELVQAEQTLNMQLQQECIELEKQASLTEETANETEETQQGSF